MHRILCTEDEMLMKQGAQSYEWRSLQPTECQMRHQIPIRNKKLEKKVKFYLVIAFR
jgi:hypothetical protein